MNGFKTISAFLVFLMLAPLALSAQNDQGKSIPAWVEYEKGVLSLSQKDYGKALLYFKKALSAAKVMPEAETGLGDVFFYQGDYALAESQYKKAYDQRLSFSVPDSRYDVLYRLSRLYFLQKRYGMMEDILKQIIKDDPVFNDTRYALFRENLLKLYGNKGFDETFKLNRIEESFATDAHAELARYYYVTWNFEPALQYALFSVIPLLTESMLEIRRVRPGYQFTTLADFLSVGLSIETVSNYLSDGDFFKRLYYLALVSYEKIPVRDSGRAFLRILAATDAAGEYQRLAKLQLENPWRERRLDDDVSGR